MNGIFELKRRIAQLDNEKEQQYYGTTDLGHFIDVMERVTSSGAVTDVKNLLIISTQEADTLQRSCHLLESLEKVVPEIVNGPVHLDAQHWIGTENSSNLPKAQLLLSKEYFVDIFTTRQIQVSTKPFYVGLFTSTAVLQTFGMWQMYLEPFSNNELFPSPWYIWAVKPNKDALIREITDAASWVEFVLSYPLFKEGLLYPNWRAVAKRYDAIHITLRAIVAAQGLYFQTKQGIIAAPYWDVESTFWLHWCFDSVKFVEKVERF